MEEYVRFCMATWEADGALGTHDWGWVGGVGYASGQLLLLVLG